MFPQRLKWLVVQTEFTTALLLSSGETCRNIIVYVKWHVGRLKKITEILDKIFR